MVTRSSSNCSCWWTQARPRVRRAAFAGTWLHAGNAARVLRNCRKQCASSRAITRKWCCRTFLRRHRRGPTFAGACRTLMRAARCSACGPASRRIFHCRRLSPDGCCWAFWWWGVAPWRLPSPPAKKPAESPGVKPAAPVLREVAPVLPPEHTTPEYRPKIAPAPSTDSEVQVFRALHEIEADLGDPVEVSRTASGEIKVVGTGLSAARQEEIRGAVGAIPNVISEWHESPVRSEARLRNAKSISTESAHNPFEAMLRPAAPRLGELFQSSTG